MGHQHSHQHGQLSGNRLLFSIILNIIITASQVIGGIISGSLALISDAVHNLSDVISLIISYAANFLSNKKKQTVHQTFGFKRAEIIAAFINSSTLIIIAVFLAIEAVKRFNKPTEIASDLVIWLAFIAILGNGLSVLLLKRDADHNLNMKSAYLHLITDMLTSVAVMIGGILMKYYQIYWLDAVLTIIISFYLLFMSWSIFIDSLKILMLFAPKGLEITAIQDEIVSLPEIDNIHHVHIWQLNDHDIHFEAHIEFNKDIKLSEFDMICSKVEQILMDKFHINHSNLQPEFERDDHKDFIIQD
ncbi:cation diffusion facilitator family transporter [Lutimonas sp.]|jgi:cobalt-zinc-cadmium efflux system protein|uniref:cation diffusion facilitator family transporter n=1 Tax=Lutimonas sp. TaxID=1872403 RepID=UPI003C7250B1